MMTKVGLFAVLVAGCASATSDAPPAPAHEVVTGGARIKGGTFRMDVQVGQGIGPRFAKGSNHARLQNATVVP